MVTVIISHLFLCALDGLSVKQQKEPERRQSEDPRHELCVQQRNPVRVRAALIQTITNTLRSPIRALWMILLSGAQSQWLQEYVAAVQTVIAVVMKVAVGKQAEKTHQSFIVMQKRMLQNWKSCLQRGCLMIQLQSEDLQRFQDRKFILLMKNQPSQNKTPHLIHQTFHWDHDRVKYFVLILQMLLHPLRVKRKFRHQQWKC